MYEEPPLSLEDIIKTTGLNNIDALKAITDINVAAYGSPHSEMSASAILKRPGLSHIKAYKFGILLGDIIIRDGEAHILSGKVSTKLKELSKELYNAVFWWEDMKDASITRPGNEYVLKKEGRIITLAGSTLLPVSQKITSDEKEIYIIYNTPAKADDVWYQSVMEITLDNFAFRITIDKLRLNPEIGDEEFGIN
ncbi:MAG: hypothetical protein HY809_07180 [Nitrospirae bacterium]|nr:hypothetical protein [Nitrospirota bacterium]